MYEENHHDFHGLSAYTPGAPYRRADGAWGGQAARLGGKDTGRPPTCAGRLRFTTRCLPQRVCRLTVGKTVLRQCLYRVYEARSAPRPLPQGQAGAEAPGHREHTSSPSIS